MTLEQRIVSRFLREHPREAARALERTPLATTLAAISSSEPEEAAQVLAAMVPSTASRILAGVEAGLATGIVGRLPSDRAAELLRRLESGQRTEITRSLEEERRALVERLLRFPPDTAGALMYAQFTCYHRSRGAGEALAELKDQGTDLRYYVYVVDDDLTLAGVLSVRELVAAPAAARLEEVMRRPVLTLSARARRSAVVRHPGWKRYPSLPVVDEAGRLIGVFPYRRFQELSGTADENSDPGALGLALALGELFWWAAASLFRGLERTENGEAN